MLGSHVPAGVVQPVGIALVSTVNHGLRKAVLLGTVVLDITERKRAEEALRTAHEELERRVKERTKELQENEARLQRLLESTSAIPWMADARTWLFTYVGPRAVDIFGYPLDQWYEKDFWVNHIHPEDREAAIDFCMKSLRSLEEFEFEYRMIAADGSVVWLHDLVSVERENGEPQTLQGFLIDVTERKQLEEESRQHKAALAHLTRVSTLGELAASLSHELNQPLTAIVSNAQATLRLLSRDTPDLDELRAALTDITDDGKRAGEVIHRLRTMQKKGDSRRDRLDINEVIREVLSLYRSDAMLKDISVECDLALNLPPVLGDQIQLQQVVLNLLLNASEAVGDLEPGSRKVVLRTSRVDSNTMEVNVRDFGTGLAPENVDRIFDAFFTTKPQGMGMGLSISRSIIEEHGGRLWATQNPERGATFHFTLPLNNGVSR